MRLAWCIAVKSARPSPPPPPSSSPRLEPGVVSALRCRVRQGWIRHNECRRNRDIRYHAAASEHPDNPSCETGYFGDRLKLRYVRCFTPLSALSMGTGHISWLNSKWHRFERRWMIPASQYGTEEALCLVPGGLSMGRLGKLRARSAGGISRTTGGSRVMFSIINGV